MNADLRIDLDVEIHRIGCNSLNIARAPATTRLEIDEFSSFHTSILARMPVV